MKADACKDGFDLGVPMTRAAAKAIDGALKEPVFVFFRVGVPNGGLNNSYLIVGLYALTEGILTIALLQCAAILHGQACDELH
jgi:hypothetical protein